MAFLVSVKKVSAKKEALETEPFSRETAFFFDVARYRTRIVSHAEEVVEKSSRLRQKHPLDGIVERAEAVDEPELLRHPTGEDPALGELADGFHVELTAGGHLRREQPVDILHRHQNNLSLLIDSPVKGTSATRSELTSGVVPVPSAVRPSPM